MPRGSFKSPLGISADTEICCTLRNFVFKITFLKIALKFTPIFGSLICFYVLFLFFVGSFYSLFVHILAQSRSSALSRRFSIRFQVSHERKRKLLTPSLDFKKIPGNLVVRCPMVRSLLIK